VVRSNYPGTEYVLTGKGLTLRPVVRSLLTWGDGHYSEGGPGLARSR